MSATSAERFAAKVRARRRRRWGAAIAVVLACGGAGWLVLASPWATVNTIEVRGTQRVDEAAVRAVAAAELDRPMLFTRPERVERDVLAGQPLARAVRVSRHWPGTVRVTVVERTPVAAVPAAGGVRLVDTDGVTVEQARRAPDGMPRVEVPLPDAPSPAQVAALRACLDVLAELPEAIGTRLVRLGADSPDLVWFDLKGGARVEWGSAADGAAKARVLTALLRQQAEVYDVRAPDAPAVRRQR